MTDEQCIQNPIFIVQCHETWFILLIVGLCFCLVTVVSILFWFCDIFIYCLISHFLGKIKMLNLLLKSKYPYLPIIVTSSQWPLSCLQGGLYGEVLLLSLSWLKKYQPRVLWQTNEVRKISLRNATCIGCILLMKRNRHILQQMNFNWKKEKARDCLIEQSVVNIPTIYFADVAVEREVEGDLFLHDVGQGLCFKPGTFDGCIR